MKLTAKISFIILIFLISFSNCSYALEFMAGAKVWYVNWRPWLTDAGQTAEDRYFGIQNVELGGGWMYGGSAALSVTNSVSISLSYLYGVLGSNFDVKDRGNVFGHDLQFQQTGSANIYRHDIDTAISYSLNSMFRIFVGYKFQPIKVKIKSSGADYNYDDSTGNFNTTSMNLKAINHCPAAGAGIVIPLNDMFVFSTNLSGLYTTGSMEYDHTRYYYDNADLSGSPDREYIEGKMDLHGWGFNVEPSIVTLFKQNIVVILGLRYQMVVMKGEYKSEDSNISYSDMIDHLYGIYFNVMYRFN